MKATAVLPTAMILFILNFTPVGLFSQEATVRASPAEAIPVKYFDPEQDPIGSIQSNGDWQLTVSEAVLIRSLRAAIPGIGTVQKVKKQKLQGKDYLAFEGRQVQSPEKALYVAILLKTDSQGQVFAGLQYHTCTGDPCSWCVIQDNGCFCDNKAPADDPGWTGTCKHTTGTQMALSKVAVTD